MGRSPELSVVFPDLTRKDRDEILGLIVNARKKLKKKNSNVEEFVWVDAVEASVNNDGVWEPGMAYPEEETETMSLRIHRIAYEINKKYSAAGLNWYLDKTGVAGHNTPPVYVWKKKNGNTIHTY